jgi:hypothetical protein
VKEDAMTATATDALDPLPSYRVRVHRLDATLADLHIELTDLPADVEVFGRLMGPRCPGVSTVEVAYPLRPVAPAVYRALIPEPVLWTPEHPCVYEGPIELHRAGRLVGTIAVSLGIRAAGPRAN